jgi:hypothetical protein
VSKSFGCASVGQQVVRANDIGQSSHQCRLEIDEVFDPPDNQVASALCGGPHENGGIDVIVLQMKEVEGGVGIPIQQGVSPAVWQGSTALLLHQPTMEP